MEVDEGSDKENDDGQDSEEEDLRRAVNTVEVKAEQENKIEQIQKESEAEDEEEENEDYEVEEIVDYTMCKKTKVGLYRVKWLG